MQAASDIELAAERMAPLGLLKRYARGRLSYLVMRQGLTATGAVTLALLVSPWIGLTAAVMALTGELFDALVLRYVLRAANNGASFRRLSRISALSAAFQATTIAACVLLAWFSVPAGTAVYFCIAFLASAALNAGIVWPFHPPSAIARLSIYGVTALVGFLSEFQWGTAFTQLQLFNAVGHFLMGYLVYVILRFVIGSHRRQMSDTERIVATAKSLERMHDKLLESQAEVRKLALVAQHANDSVILSGIDRKIMWVNHGFEAITGYTRDEAVGKSPGDLFNGPGTNADTIAKIEEAMVARRAFRTEILNYRKDGSEIWVETNLVPVAGEDGGDDMVIAIERDISALKAHEAEMAAARIAAERGERAKSEFLATMSHEIRTPMNAIIGLSDLLTEHDLPAEAQTYAETIKRSSEGLLTIINDVLDLSKLDAGKMSVDPVEFDLPDCIDQVVQLFSGQASAKSLYLDVIEETPLPKRVIGDNGRLRQMLVNLIGNALKFTEKGGVTIRLTSVEREGFIDLAIAVVDTGIGIPKSQLDGIFDKFAQADSQTTRKFGGTGLGLTISRMIARRMGGDIIVASQEGAGSTFCVSVRMQIASDKQSNAPSEEGRHVEVPPLKVLVAEDNKTNRFLIEKYLKNTPVSLTFAVDGREAVDAVMRAPPDVIFMDMSMPRMDGLEATRRIRAAELVQPYIVALTANAFATDKTACFDAGMDDFLAKPVRKADLMSKLAQVGARQVTGSLPP